MKSPHIEGLLSKLNPVCQKGLENALGTCMHRTNYSIEIEHWLQKLLEHAGSDLCNIFEEFSIDAREYVSQLMVRLDGLKRGNTEPPTLSDRLIDLIGDSWMVASVEFQKQRIASGHVLCALLDDDRYRVLSELSNLDTLDSRRLRRQLGELTSGGFEADVERSLGGEAVVDPSGETGAVGEGSGLEQFTINLTAQAKAGNIDPVIGRDSEIRQIMDILLRRRQNNPILTGEAGVGKTAVAEGFALRIAADEVPDSLRGVTLLSLDLGSLQAGASVKGEFERRLKGVIDEVKASPQPIILFIDEAHNLVGAGGQAGQGDAANLLKPALARGELRTIAATTWAEYKKYFQEDAALARRFQPVVVDEPDEEVAQRMLQGLLPTLEEHHGVRITSDALEAAVRLSNRYISGRQLPDKAVSVLDTACARIALSQSSTPAQVEDAERQLHDLDLSLEILAREARTGLDRSKEQAEVTSEREQVEAIVNELQQQWKQEHELVIDILQLRTNLLGPVVSQNPNPESGQLGRESSAEKPEASVEVANLSEEERVGMLEELKSLESSLLEMQGERPMVHPDVTMQAVAETVEAWTGIPLGRMVADEIQSVLKLREKLEESVIGQSHALEMIAQSIITSRAKMSDPNKPIGVFLLCGTSGVGKTETAISLAEQLYGSADNMVTIDMSQLKSEEMAQTKLFGASAGYVGYGKGGIMEVIRRKPYSVVLLDEFEKADPSVQDLFYQIFDQGLAQDGEGRTINFRNTVILMTTNAATDLIRDLCADRETMPGPEAFMKAVFPELLKSFAPAFLGRSTLVPFYPLADHVLENIVRLKLSKVTKRLQENYDATLDFSEEVVQQILARCTEADTGARNIDHILNKSMLPELSTRILSALATEQKFTNLCVEVADDGQFEYTVQ